jgi:hypothetical protein
MSMRLPIALSTGLAALGAIMSAGQAEAHQPRERGAMMPPPPMADDYDYDQDMPPPPPPMHYDGPHSEYDGPDGPYRGGPMPGPWMAPQCGEHHHGHAVAPGCARYGYPMTTYAVPMMMVPVLRQKPCPEKVVEEWVEEPVPVRRRYIPRRAVPDKRIRLVPDKRVPTKRIPY